MCDQHFEDDMKKYLDGAALTRRQFGAMSVGVGMAMLLPRAANALTVTESEVNVKTPDGVADCYFVHPSSGAHAGVVIGRTSSASGLHSGRWANGSPSPATRSWW